MNLNTEKRTVSFGRNKIRYIEMKTQNMKIKKSLRNSEVEKKENYNHTIEGLRRSY
jgi:hypothetical protein